MERKLKDYFFAGVRLVWYIDLKKQTAEVYTSPDQRVTVEEAMLDGGDVLPGFRLPMRSVFDRLPPHPSRKANGRPEIVLTPSPANMPQPPFTSLPPL